MSFIRAAEAFADEIVGQVLDSQGLEERLNEIKETIVESIERSESRMQTIIQIQNEQIASLEKRLAATQNIYSERVSKLEASLRDVSPKKRRWAFFD